MSMSVSKNKKRPPIKMPLINLKLTNSYSCERPFLGMVPPPPLGSNLGGGAGWAPTPTIMNTTEPPKLLYKSWT